jgi:hypothetical protein
MNMVISFIQSFFKKKKSIEKTEESLKTKKQKSIRNTQMTEQENPPSIKKTAFECPHCGAYTTQVWFTLYAEKLPDGFQGPFFPNEEFIKEIDGNKEVSADIVTYWEKVRQEMLTGLVFFKKKEKRSWAGLDVKNLNISKCFHCKKITVWVHDGIVFPSEKQGVLPNQDLPDDIIKDFEEARAIVSLSPRGGAALLRLCIQKLCDHLGAEGNNINQNIGNLVEKGLNPLVQQSLDIVRVIGNEAVHPGVIDLNDDRDTANTLFDLVNSITEQMITHPKNVEKMYSELPESKREAIERRDGIAEEE